MRIIAGENRGHKLKSVPGVRTRPTADRVREAVFSSLEPLLPGSRFLDVFGGTGAVALEALSRGAASATILERDRAALAVIRDNIAACRQQPRCRLLGGDSLALLERLLRQGAQFDLVYVDPPYREDLYAAVLERLGRGLLAPGGMILLESAKNTSLSIQNSIFYIHKEKYYGGTRVSYLKQREPAPSPIQ